MTASNFSLKQTSIPVDQANALPWIEKYRPRFLKEIASQEKTIEILKNDLQNINIPHLLFYGPPGTGKTSTILALASELFGAELVRHRVLELNASDDRGIAIIREKVKDFAKSSLITSKSSTKRPTFKIVILDEADSMTQDAQAALRRIMELYSKTTRFCLICNYMSRIIEPVASRCSKFRFKSIEIEESRRRILQIINYENLQYEDEALNLLLKVGDGDLRRCITYLQSCHNLSQGTGDGNAKDLNCKALTDIAGIVSDDEIDQIWESCVQTNDYKRYNLLTNAAQDIVYASYSAQSVINQLHDKIIADERHNQKSIMRIIEKLAMTEKRVNDGADEFLQLLDLFFFISDIMNNEKRR